ncbi:MAG: hypothetical protein HY777_08300 [Betaproteobacteria bacterium]|nr:hypothetical protein [Betaproteobacteria bacterium]
MRIRGRAHQACVDAGVEIEHVSKSHIRGEELVARVLATRGGAPGLAHVVSAMGACPTHVPWHDKGAGKTCLKATRGKCPHYCFCVIDDDDELGLRYLRVPTLTTFNLRFYRNGHSVLARALSHEGIDHLPQDNAFSRIAEVARAQELADAFSPGLLHRRPDHYAQQFCPVFDVFGQVYHWSLRQVEHSTDPMFCGEQILVPLYGAISRQAVLAANAGRVSGFLGKKVTPLSAQEIGSRLSTRIGGLCTKHYTGVAGVKVYDKFSRVLRVETTVDDVSFFKHHRKVEHTDGEPARKLASMKKTIYSLIDLREILLGCNQRYLAFLSSLDDPSAGERDLQRLGQPRVGTSPSVKGLNFFDADEQTLLRTLQRGEINNPAASRRVSKPTTTARVSAPRGGELHPERFNIHGWRCADLFKCLSVAPSAMSRQLKRFRVLGAIKKVGHTYRYYLTRPGRAAIAAACSLTRFSIVPAMASTQ